MVRKIRPIERAVWIGFLWLVPQHDHNLSGRVYAGVIVVMQIRRCDAITCKKNRAIEASSIGEYDRYELLVDLKFVAVQLQLVVRSKLSAGRDLKSLEIGIAIPHRAKVPVAEL